MDIYSAPGVAFEAGVEQTFRVLERGALGERQLHDALVRLAGTDQSIVRPHRNAAPLPLFDHFRVRLLDENADMGESLAPPVVQFLDPRVDQPRGGFALGSCALFHIVCISLGCFSILRRVGLARRYLLSHPCIGNQPSPTRAVPSSRASWISRSMSASLRPAVITSRRNSFGSGNSAKPLGGGTGDKAVADLPKQRRRQEPVIEAVGRAARDRAQI